MAYMSVLTPEAIASTDAIAVVCSFFFKIKLSLLVYLVKLFLDLLPLVFSEL